jgi:hypothetical protein
VEGKSDKAFLEELLRRFFSAGDNGKGEGANSTISDVEIVECGGWTNLASNNQVKRAIEGEKPVLIVFDADRPDNDRPDDDGGFEKRLAAIQKKIGELAKVAKVAKVGTDIPIFLFPNNRDDGDFETLLEKMVREEHRDIVQCWQNYVDCITSKSYIDGNASKKYNPPTQKSKVHEYAAAIDSDVWKKQEGFNKTFAKDSVWNWNSPALSPLKEFLTKHLL